ncbi:MAG: Ig-like domain-containing protein [bacterium]
MKCPDTRIHRDLPIGRIVGIYGALCALLILLSACGSNYSEDTGHNTGSIGFSLTWERPEQSPVIGQFPAIRTKAAPGGDCCESYGIEYINAYVYNAAGKEVASRNWPCSAGQGTISNVPSGTGLRVRIEGTITGAVVWEGERTGISVMAGQSTNAGVVSMSYKGTDKTPPVVISSVPLNGAIDVPLTQRITVTFNEDVAPPSVNTTTFTLVSGSTLIRGIVTYDADSKTASFIPAGGSFSPSTAYTVTITNGVEDRAGNSMASNYIGSFTTVPLQSGRTLWAWGWNEEGQLGDGANTDKNTPVQIGTDNQWVSIAAGWAHTVALKSDGTLWAWGRNDVGQLGDGTNSDKNIPVQIGTDNQWVSISANSESHHTLALKSDGTLWAWGRNDAGQLGDGTNSDKNTPVQIGTDNQWAAIAAGWGNSLALKSDGTLWAWGRNDVGQLGDGTNIDKNTPVRIGTDNEWIAIAAGGKHTVALKSDGTLWAWGRNEEGQLGDGTNIDKNTPVRIGTDNKWVSIAEGGFHTIALKSDGTLWAWGSNGSGELGDGTNIGKNIPVRIGTDNNWVSIAAGWFYTTALKSNGTLWAWGSNGNGKLGNGTYIDKNTPVQIGTDAQWISIAAGYCHTAALKSGNIAHPSAPTQVSATAGDAKVTISWQPVEIKYEINSPPENIAYNPAGSGYPDPSESDPGWGGGSWPWQMIDGLRWYEGQWQGGLAFTGGTSSWGGPCGWRQATINFGEPKTFNRVAVWHHGCGHLPNTYKIQYWDGTNWIDVFSTGRGHDYLPFPELCWSTPTVNLFDPVTSDKVRLTLNNCDMDHGWIYELEVYNNPHPIPVSYAIYWSKSPGVSKTNYEGKIDDITATSYTHTGLINGTTYYYRVTAKNSSGESDMSDEVWAKPDKVTWTEKTPMPNPVSAFGYAVVDGVIYIIGGDSSASSTSTVQRYNPATDTWQSDTDHGGTLAPLPKPRSLLFCGVINRKIHAIGGWENGSYKGDHFVYEPDTNTWQTGPSIPQCPIGQFSATINNKIYVFGGWRGIYNNLVFEYSEETGWSSKSPMPTPRNHGITGVYDGKLYVIGGQGGQPAQQQPLDVVEIYDPQTDTWSTGLAPMPSPQHWLGSSGSPVLNGIIYVLGPGNTAYSYNPQSDSWEILNSMPDPTCSASGISAINDSLYAIGPKHTFKGIRN